MSTVVFGSTTLVTSSAGTHYGSYECTIGDIEEEIHEASFPRSNGILEKTSGLRRCDITLDVLYMTTSPSDVLSVIWQIRARGVYATLTVGSMTFPFCRLAEVRVMPGRGGARGNSAVTVLPVQMVFRRVYFGS
jgi:hypothetical protein